MESVLVELETPQSGFAVLSSITQLELQAVIEPIELS
jgi:hypothetical protein